jgi:hypothetical protein
MGVDAGSISRIVPIQDPVFQNCSSRSFDPHTSFKWIFFLAQTLWDSVCFLLSTYSLVRQVTGVRRVTPFLRSLLKEGCFYFIIMAAFNASNLFLLLSENTECVLE